MKRCTFQQVLWQNLSWLLSQDRKTYFIRFHFKVNRKSIGPFEKSICFYVTITGHFQLFIYFNFKTNFLKNENLFGKKMENRLKVENTKTEIAIFLHKTSMSKANVKATRTDLSQRTGICKDRGFASNYFIFLKILFQFKNLI